MARVDIDYDTDFHNLAAKAIQERDLELLNDIEIEIINQMITPEERDAKLALLAAAANLIEDAE